MARSSVQISILVVDDDPICLSLVSGILQKLNYHVVAMKNPVDALCTLRMRSESFHLILTDVHMPEMSGLELLKHADEEFKVPVVLMSADTDKVIMLKGLQDGASFYFVKPISPDNLARVWQFASSGITRIHTIDLSPINPTQTSYDNNKNNSNNNNNKVANKLPLSSKGKEKVGGGTSSDNPKLKRASADHDTQTKDKNGKRKKPKLVWTTTLHNQFLEAVYKIGMKKAVPKKILEYMKVPGLKRENVASHLQKYRIFLKRISDASKQGVANNWDERPFRSSFVLNEITYLTNNLQQQYQELLSNSKGKAKGIANGTNRSTYERGQCSNHQEGNSSGDNPNKKTNNNNGSSDMQLDPSQGTRATDDQVVLTTKEKPKPSSEGYGQPNVPSDHFNIGGTSSNEIPNNSQLTGSLQCTTSNYVGLRITPNGELFGTLKDMPVVNIGGQEGGDYSPLANVVNDVPNNQRNVAQQEETIEKTTTYNTSWDEPNPVSGMDTDVNVYVPSIDPVDNIASHPQETSFTMSQPVVTANLDLSEELREIGIDIDIHFNQEIFGNDISIGSYDDMQQSNAPTTSNVDGFDQGLFGTDDFTVDYFLQDYGDLINQDEWNDFTK